AWSRLASAVVRSALLDLRHPPTRASIGSKAARQRAHIYDDAVAFFLDEPPDATIVLPLWRCAEWIGVSTAAIRRAVATQLAAGAHGQGAVDPGVDVDHPVDHDGDRIVEHRAEDG